MSFQFQSSRRVRSLFAVLSLSFAAVTSSGCDQVPSELVPLFNPITNLRGLPDGQERPFDMVVRNVGTAAVNISSVAVAEAPGHEGEDANFTAQIAEDVIEGGAESVLRIIYSTPGGAAQTAIIRIQSDAAVNPELEIEVITDPLVIIPVDGGPEVDAGDADAGETDAGETDAGDVDAGEEDAGIADAGVVDAGGNDAGFDAGVVDAGAIDAGTPDAGVTDSGVSDAGN